MKAVRQARLEPWQICVTTLMPCSSPGVSCQSTTLFAASSYFRGNECKANTPERSMKPDASGCTVQVFPLVRNCNCAFNSEEFGNIRKCAELLGISSSFLSKPVGNPDTPHKHNGRTRTDTHIQMDAGTTHGQTCEGGLEMVVEGFGGWFRLWMVWAVRQQ